MIWISLIVAVLFMIGLVLYLERDSCPRASLLGYHCHGEKCDHSRAEWKRVKEQMK